MDSEICQSESFKDPNKTYYLVKNGGLWDIRQKGKLNNGITMFVHIRQNNFDHILVMTQTKVVVSIRKFWVKTIQQKTSILCFPSLFLMPIFTQRFVSYKGFIKISSIFVYMCIFKLIIYAIDCNIDQTILFKLFLKSTKTITFYNFL